MQTAWLTDLPAYLTWRMQTVVVDWSTGLTYMQTVVVDWSTGLTYKQTVVVD